MNKKNMKRMVFFLQFFLLAGCKSQMEGELLGKTREQVLAYISHSNYKFHDTIYTDPSLYIKEYIEINNVVKWNSEIEENITLDSSYRVVIFMDHFNHLPTPENKVMGMKKEDRDKALEDLSKKHGKPEIIKKDFNIYYHWQDSLNIYEYFELETPTNDYYGYFTAETKKYRAYQLSLPLSLTSFFSKFIKSDPDSLLHSLPDSLLHRVDSLRFKILISPFVK